MTMKETAMKKRRSMFRTQQAIRQTVANIFMNRYSAFSFLVLTMMAVLWGFTGVAQAAHGAALDKLKTVKTVASTVPSNGDINPYGVAEVRRTTGHLTAGHILVSNFNNSLNRQGTGSTIVDVAPDGTVALFAQLNADTLPGSCPGGVGLTTALAVLKSGWVIVGSLPTTDGTAATAQAGCLIVLDSMGNPVETFFGTLINGPWDMTAFEDGHEAKLFVTNVLNGTVAADGEVVNQGTVVRIDLNISEASMPWVESMTVIGFGFAERTDPAALVIGPTGVGLGSRGQEGRKEDRDDDKDGDEVLYVADSLNNRIQVIPHALKRATSAGTGSTLFANGSLNDPLGLVVAHNGHILTVNGNDGFIIEITPQGHQIAKVLLDNTGTPPGAGTLFGLAFDPKAGVYFVDNGTNTLNVLQ
jgi:hypothetical protein